MTRSMECIHDQCGKSHSKHECNARPCASMYTQIYDVKLREAGGIPILIRNRRPASRLFMPENLSSGVYARKEWMSDGNPVVETAPTTSTPLGFDSLPSVPLKVGTATAEVGSTSPRASKRARSIPVHNKGESRSRSALHYVSSEAGRGRGPRQPTTSSRTSTPKRGWLASSAHGSSAATEQDAEVESVASSDGERWT